MGADVRHADRAGRGGGDLNPLGPRAREKGAGPLPARFLLPLSPGRLVFPPREALVAGRAALMMAIGAGRRTAPRGRHPPTPSADLRRGVERSSRPQSRWQA